MANMSVERAVGPAFQHMVRVLFRPFLLRKWLALGFVGLLGYGHNFSFRYSGGVNEFTPGSGPQSGPAWQFLSWLSHHEAIVIAAVALFVLLGLLFAWLAGVFRFVYIEAVVGNSCAVKEPFHRFRGLGTSYFLFTIGFTLIFILAALLIVGLPMISAFSSGASTGLQVLTVAWGVIVGIPLLIFGIVTGVLMQEMVSSVMYLRGVRALEAWRIFLPILRDHPGQFALYLLLLLAFGIASTIVVAIAAVLATLVLLIPFGIPAAAAVLIGAAAGLTWTPVTIAIAAAYGGIFICAAVYAVSCLTQPVSVFLQSYSLAVLGQADSSLVTVPTGLPPDETPEQ